MNTQNDALVVWIEQLHCMQQDIKDHECRIEQLEDTHTASILTVLERIAEALEAIAQSPPKK